MSKPIVDKAEVSIDFPDKFYHGSFSHTSRFDVNVDEQGVHIVLDRPGDERRHVAFHLHHHLFSSILESLAEQVTSTKTLPPEHRTQLRDATAKLGRALKK
ncbi:MAG: hypothetical protein GY948_03070 [Alphaproteobacteria bacterium]|nr:hypothetical protein [Alphaproteobacteria bacterium]